MKCLMSSILSLSDPMGSLELSVSTSGENSHVNVKSGKDITDFIIFNDSCVSISFISIFSLLYTKNLLDERILFFLAVLIIWSEQKFFQKGMKRECVPVMTFIHKISIIMLYVTFLFSPCYRVWSIQTVSNLSFLWLRGNFIFEVPVHNTT